jgi:hypothetical protein
MNLGQSMSNRKNFSPTVTALLISGVGVLLALLSSLDVVNDRFSFILLTLLLLTYLWREVWRLRLLHPDRWLLNPIVLSSLMTFMMGYGITNIIFFMPENQLTLLGLVPKVTPAMVKLMGLVLLGAVAMWLGYWSPIAESLSRPRMIEKFQSHFLPKTNSLKPFALPALVSIAVGARLLQIKLGIFGYSSSYDRLIEMGAITQYLSLAAGLGKLALVLATFKYYSFERRKGTERWFYSILAIELIFGFLSGFKSAVVIPFIILSLCQYLRTGKYSRYWIILGMASILAAYIVIEPFRAARTEDTRFSGTSITSIAGTMISAPTNSVEKAVESAPLLMSIASRFNLSYIGSFAISFSDGNTSLPKGSPAFLADIFLAPLHAWIPRLIWDSKPLGNLGLWYNQVVMGMDNFSSTAMGPFAYLYFSGGFFAVFIGFLFIGTVQRILFFILTPRTSSAGGVIFLTILSTLSIIDSSFSGIIITLCRELPLAILLQFVIFRSNVNNKIVAINHPFDKY